MSTLAVNTITAETGNTVSLASGKTLNASNGFTPPAGHVIQVIQQTASTSVSSTSNAWVTGGLAATITPSSASSKILVSVTTTVLGTPSTDALTKIFRGTVSGTGITGNATTKYNHSSSEPSGIGIQILDSPNTTSAQTYTYAIRSSVNNQQVTTQVANTLGTIILMEIAG